MTNKICCILLFFAVFHLNAQTKGIVVDSLGTPIPYVNIWVDGEKCGTTSEENGTFELNCSNAKVLVFSAVGFETKNVNLLEAKKVILKTKINKLAEVQVIKRKNKKQILIGKFKKSAINYYYAAANPVITATKIKSTKLIPKNAFIKEISFLTLSEKEGVSINLRFFDVDKNGKPGNDLLKNNILIKAKKGKNISKVLVDTLNISIPEEGLFIAFEWLIIENNKLETKLDTVDKTTDGQLYVSFLPNIGMVPSATQDTWQFINSEWRKTTKHAKDENRATKYDDKFQNMALTLKLTD